MREDPIEGVNGFTVSTSSESQRMKTKSKEVACR